MIIVFGKTCIPKKEITMSKDNEKFKISFDTDKESLVPDEDEAFERQQAQLYRDAEENGEYYAQQAKKEEERLRREYEQKLRREKIEMMKQKQGIEEEQPLEDSDDEEPVKMSFWKKVENFWYHYKWVTIITAVVVLFGGYMIYDLVTKVEPDLTIVATPDNGISYRGEELENFFEGFCDDVNGDGEVYVSVVFAPLDPDSVGDNYSQANQSKLFSTLSSARCVLVLSDDSSDFSLENVAFEELSDTIDSQYVSGTRLSLTSPLVKEAINWAQMPQDMYISMRTPVKTLNDSQEDMQKTCDIAQDFLKRLAEAMNNYPS